MPRRHAAGGLINWSVGGSNPAERLVLAVNTYLARGGGSIGKASQASVAWSGQPPELENIKVLNNLVWEFLNVRNPTVSGTELKQEFRLPLAEESERGTMPLDDSVFEAVNEVAAELGVAGL